MSSRSRNVLLILVPLFLASCAAQGLEALVPIETAQRQVLRGAEIIPAGRLTVWEPGKTVGVPGGIPTGRTPCATAECEALRTASPELRNGITNATPVLQAAINSAPPNSVVYIPAGTWRIEWPVRSCKQGLDYLAWCGHDHRARLPRLDLHFCRLGQRLPVVAALPGELVTSYDADLRPAE